MSYLDVWDEYYGDGGPGAKTGIFNVRHFGATGDGATDDTAAIQEALNEAAAFYHAGDFDLGGLVVVPNGTYMITSTLEIGTGTYMQGHSPLATLKREAGEEFRALVQSLGWEIDDPAELYHGTIGLLDITLNGNYGEHGDDAVDSGFGCGGLYLKGDCFKLRNVHIAHCRGVGLWTTGTPGGVGSGEGISQTGGQSRLHDFAVGFCYGDDDILAGTGAVASQVFIGGSTDQNICNFQILHSSGSGSGDDLVALNVAAGGHKISDFHIWSAQHTTTLRVASINNQIRNFTVESVRSGGLLIDVTGGSNEIDGHIYHHNGSETTHGIKFSGSWQKNVVRLIADQVIGKVVEFASNSGTDSDIFVRAWRNSTSASPITYTSPVTDIPADVSVDIAWSWDAGSGQVIRRATKANVDHRVAGDMTWEATGKGPVIKSPDGTKYRVQVANGGALSTTAV